MKKSHKILVVDDEATNLLMLERVLRSSHDVVTARDGEEAVEVLKRENISLLITDQRMPGMAGTELIREAQKLKPGIISILLTSNKDVDTFIDAVVKSGALKVINKPWDAESLLNVVASSLQRYDTFVERQGSIDRMKRMSDNLEKIVNPQ